MNRFRQQKDLPWALEAHSRGCVVCRAGVEKGHWGAGISWVSVPYMSDRRDICATGQPKTAPAFETPGVSTGLLLHLECVA